MLIKLDTLFHIYYGHSLELNRLFQVDRNEHGIPFVSRKMGDNGISAYVKAIPKIAPAGKWPINLRIRRKWCLVYISAGKLYFTLEEMLQS